MRLKNQAELEEPINTFTLFFFLSHPPADRPSSFDQMNLLSNNNRSRLHAQIPQQLKLCLAMMLILVFATGNLSFAASGSSSPTLPAPVAIGALPTDGCTAQGFDATSSIPSLRQCLSNLGGGTSACAALNANDQQSEYLQCWCLQQTQQSNCFQVSNYLKSWTKNKMIS